MGKKPWLKSLGLLTQLGIVMVTPILICMYFGIFLDEKTNKAPLFTIIMLVLGTLGAFRNLFYYVTKQAKKNERENKKDE